MGDAIFGALGLFGTIGLLVIAVIVVGIAVHALGRKRGDP